MIKKCIHGVSMHTECADCGPGNARTIMSPETAQKIQEEDMFHRGVYDKYLDAMEAWIRAIVYSCVSTTSVGDITVRETRLQLMQIIFDNKER